MPLHLLPLSQHLPLFSVALVSLSLLISSPFSSILPLPLRRRPHLLSLFGTGFPFGQIGPNRGPLSNGQIRPNRGPLFDPVWPNKGHFVQGLYSVLFGRTKAILFSLIGHIRRVSVRPNRTERQALRSAKQGRAEALRLALFGRTMPREGKELGAEED